MRYRIEYADGRYCNFANGRAELLKWLKLLKQEEISDIRKVYKSGVSDSVFETEPELYPSSIRRGAYGHRYRKLVDLMIQERMQSPVR